MHGKEATMPPQTTTRPTPAGSRSELRTIRVLGQRLKIAVRPGDGTRTPLLLMNGIVANLELLVNRALPQRANGGRDTNISGRAATWPDQENDDNGQNRHAVEKCGVHGAVLRNQPPDDDCGDEVERRHHGHTVRSRSHDSA